jgi:hypothetical protein
MALSGEVVLWLAGEAVANSTVEHGFAMEESKHLAMAAAIDVLMQLVLVRPGLTAEFAFEFATHAEIAQ